MVITAKEADKAKETDKDKETDKVEDYEQRYKDSQAHITKIEQENATMRESTAKDKELLDTISPYVNWDAASGTPKSEADDEGYVDKKTLNDQLSKIRTQITENQQLQYFRSRHPELVEYETVVSAFFSKTDPRKKFEKRLESAVENTKKLLESQRTKGAEDAEEEKKEKAAKEAEAGGLSVAKGAKGEEKEPEGETYEEYVKNRKAQIAKTMGV